MGVIITQRGDFNRLEKWLNSLRNREYLNVLSKYGQKGVEALIAATPVDTGLAAHSWNFQIDMEKGLTTLTWYNDDIEGGLSVVILVDRGHATKSGSWVPGVHFVDNALDPVIKQLEDALWREVTD